MKEEELQAFLDVGTSFEGKVSFSGTVRMDGHFKGEGVAEGTLVVGETGTVEADLTVRSLIIRGSVIGNIIAKERVHRVDVSFATAVRVISKWGAGSSELLARMQAHQSTGHR